MRARAWVPFGWQNGWGWVEFRRHSQRHHTGRVQCDGASIAPKNYRNSTKNVCVFISAQMDLNRARSQFRTVLLLFPSIEFPRRRLACVESSARACRRMNGQAPHLAPCKLRVKPGGRVHEDTVVVQYSITCLPFVAHYALRRGREVYQLLQKLTTRATRAGFHPDDGAIQPVALARGA